MNNSKWYRNPAILGMLAVLVLIVGAIIYTQNRNTIDQAPSKDSTSADYSNEARIVNGRGLFEKLNGVTEGQLLARDLFVFGEKQYAEYRDSDKVVGFEVDGDVTRKDNEVKFGGRYGSSKNRIEVTVKLLKYERIHTVIKDTKTNITMEAELPSNSKRNTFIADLPFATDVYSVEYSIDTDSFVLVVYSRDGAEIDAAVDDFAKQIGVTTEQLKDENYSVIVQGGAAGGSFAD